MRFPKPVLLILAALLASAGAMPAAAEPGVETIGPWEVRQIKDAMTDVVTVVAGVDAGVAKHYLFLTCKPSEPGRRQMGLNFTPFLGRGDGRFTYRIDDRPPVQTGIKLFNESGYVSVADSQAFFGQLPGAKRVRIQVVDQIIGVSAADYDVTGVDKVLARLAALCDGPAKP